MKIKELFKNVFWFDWIHIFSILIMISLILFEKKIGLKNWGVAIGITLFTIWTIFNFLLGKKKNRKFTSEKIIFTLIFIGYSIISLALASKRIGLISPLTLVLSILLIIAFFFGMALIIWSNFLIKNRKKPLLSNFNLYCFNFFNSHNFCRFIRWDRRYWI